VTEVNLVYGENLATWDLLAELEILECLVKLETKEPQVHMVYQESRELLA